MKRIYYIRIIASIILAASVLFILSQARAQGDIVADLRTRLDEQGVPLKDIKLTSRIPFAIEVIVQSSSTQQAATPDDALFVHTVQRGVALASKKHNIKLDTVQLTIVDTQGNLIYWSDVPIKSMSDIPTPMLNNGEITNWMRSNLSTHGMSLESLSVSSDKGSNGKIVNLRLSAKDIQTANNGLSQFLNDLNTQVGKLNAEQGAGIIIYEVHIIDATGHSILKYVRDIQMAQENWWMAEGVTKDWFPHPPSSSPDPVIPPTK